MIREIIKPTDSTITVRLPDEMIGKTIEVIAFEIEPVDKGKVVLTKEQRLQKIQELTAKTLTDLSNYKFNRDDATNYDD